MKRILLLIIPIIIFSNIGVLTAEPGKRTYIGLQEDKGECRTPGLNQGDMSDEEGNENPIPVNKKEIASIDTDEQREVIFKDEADLSTNGPSIPSGSPSEWIRKLVLSKSTESSPSLQPGFTETDSKDQEMVKTNNDPKQTGSGCNYTIPHDDIPLGGGYTMKE